MSDAARILERTRSPYANCRSYRDIGEATTVSIRGEKPWQRFTFRKPFQTAFVRPHRFLFEFKEMSVGPNDEWPHRAVWRNAVGVFTWATHESETRGIEPCPSIERVLEQWSAASDRASHIVPHLLGLCGGTSPLPETSAVELVGRDEVDGRGAWRIQSTRFAHVEVHWIDVDRHLVLRTFARTRHTPELHRALRDAQLSRPELTADERERLAREPVPTDSFTLETTVFYRPEFDIDIDDRAFDVRPPA